MPMTLDQEIWRQIGEDAIQNQDRLTTTTEKIRFTETRYNMRLDEAIYNGIRAITKSAGPHDDIIWEAAAKWTRDGNFELFMDNLEPAQIVHYLGCFGYPVESLLQSVGKPFVGWGENATRCPWPQISFTIGDGVDANAHEEHAGCTWYLIDIKLGPIPAKSERHHGPYVLEEDASNSVQVTQNGDSQLVWRAPRRLLHLREALHDYIKLQLQQAYGDRFGATPFAKLGGPKGTTARLRAWLNELAALINERGASPEIVTRTIMFFRPPTYLKPSMGLAVRTATQDAPESDRREDQMHAPPADELHRAGYAGGVAASLDGSQEYDDDEGVVDSMDGPDEQRLECDGRERSLDG